MVPLFGSCSIALVEWLIRQKPSLGACQWRRLGYDRLNDTHNSGKCTEEARPACPNQQNGRRPVSSRFALVVTGVAFHPSKGLPITTVLARSVVACRELRARPLGRRTHPHRRPGGAGGGSRVRTNLACLGMPPSRPRHITERPAGSRPTRIQFPAQHAADEIDRIGVARDPDLDARQERPAPRASAPVIAERPLTLCRGHQANGGRVNSARNPPCEA